jgi:large subunit ribosomal protein L7/L12
MNLRSARMQVARPVAAFSTSTSRFAEAESSAPLSPKIAPIVDQISGLTLLEVSELVSALKVRRGGGMPDHFASR